MNKQQKATKIAVREEERKCNRQCFGSVFIEPGSGSGQKSQSGSRQNLLEIEEKKNVVHKTIKKLSCV